MFRQITIAAMTLTLTAFATTTSQAAGGHSGHAGHSSHSSHMASNHRDHRNGSFRHEHHRHFGGHSYGYGWGYPTYSAVEYAPTDVVVEPVVETEPVVEDAAVVEPVAVATSTVCEPVSYGIDGYAPSWGYGNYRGHYNHLNSGHFNSGHHGSFQGHGEHKGGGRRG